MSIEMYQYEAIVSDDYSYDFVERLACIMKINFDGDKFEKAVECEDIHNPESVCIYRDTNNKDRFVMFDSNGPNYIHSIVVRCINEEHEYIKKEFLCILNEILEDAGHPLVADLKNTFSDIDNRYNKALKKFNLNDI